MTHEQATFLRNEVFLPQIENEHKTTRRLIEALPSGKTAFRPDDRSMSAWELATICVASSHALMERSSGLYAVFPDGSASMRRRVVLCSFSICGRKTSFRRKVACSCVIPALY